MEHGKVGELFNFGVLHMEWPSALFVFVVFMITMFLLNRLLFKPILQTLDLRQAGVDKNEQKAEELLSSLEEAERNYQGKLEEMQQMIQASRQAALEEAKSEANAIVAAAKESTDKKITEAEESLLKEKEAALAEAKNLTKGLAELINTKVIG